VKISDLSTVFPTEPRTEYAQRLAARRTEVTRLAQVSEGITRGRLAVFIVAVGLWWFGVHPGLLAEAWLLLPIVAFLGLIVTHERIRRAARLASRSVRFYEKGLARLDDRWAGSGEPGDRFSAHHHPYAQDLDLFGRGSLFELLCTARTAGGEQMLAEWLLSPAPREEILQRQEALAELRENIDLREKLALQGEDVRAALHPESLMTWGRMPPQTEQLGWWRVGAAALAIFNVATLVSWVKFEASPIPFLVAVLLSGWLNWRLRAQMQTVMLSIPQAGRDLRLLSAMFACIEEEQFLCQKLGLLRARLETRGLPPSRQIARLGKLINLLESQNNQIFIPFAALLVWTAQCTLAIEAWRRAVGSNIGEWLQALSEFETLGAFAGYAYEHPRDPFPEVTTTEVCFDGEDIGHPLLPSAHCVRNSVRLVSPLQTLIVSGSNMSGKSTLLRTVGINAVLAFAGAPVRAQRLRVSPLAIGATLRIQDSLQEGSSRFYAEITRLSILMKMTAESLPLLFLLDEILHGTNSHDRQIGAEAIVRSLIKRGAIGLVTTHDLALAQVAESLSPRAANVCFEDHFEDGKLVFDYRMRPGIVQKSNALALMRSVGLDV
jgi:hypothetical protein